MLVLTVAVPVVMDPTTKGVFSLSKVTVLALGVCALVGLWGAAWALDRRLPVWRNGLHWPLAAVVAWAAVSTATSIAPRVSFLGFAASHDGLVTAVLMAAVVVATAEAVTVARLRLVLGALYLGAGGVVTAYALLQLLDRLTGSTGTWDPIDLKDERLPLSWVWSTFGNPNHLAGFFAILLPIGVVLFVATRHALTRLAIAGMAASMGLVLVRTGARGAFLAALLGLGLLAVLQRRRFPFRPRVVAVGGAIALGTLLAAGPLVGGPPVARQLASIVDTGTGTNFERIEYWRASWRIAADRPLVGTGPDTFRLVYNRHQSARYVEALGPTRIVNGPHNFLMAQLSQQGVGGVVAVLALLATAALRAVGARRRLRRAEAAAGARQRDEIGRTLLLLDGVICAEVAYVVQAAFNVNVVPLQFVFALGLGLVAAVALDAGVPVTLRPRRLLDADDVAEAPAPTAGRRTAPRGRRGRAPIVLAWMAGVVALALAVVAVTPYRADRAYTRGREDGRLAVALLRQGAVAEGRRRAEQAVDAFEKAIARNPWESTYRGNLGSLHAQLALAEQGRRDDPVAVQAVVDHFREARRRYLEALALQPTNAQLLATVADVLARMHDDAPPGTFAGDGDADREVAAVYRRAVAANPRDPAVSLALAEVLDEDGRADDARRVLTDALRRQPEDAGLLAALARSYDAAGEPERARPLWERVLALDPDDEEARQALATS